MKITTILAKVNISKNVLMTYDRNQKYLMQLLSDSIKFGQWLEKDSYEWNFTGIKKLNVRNKKIVYGKLFKRKITGEVTPVLKDDNSDIIEEEILSEETPYSNFVLDLKNENILFQINNRITIKKFCYVFSKLCTRNNPDLGEITVIPKTIDSFEKIIGSFKRITFMRLSSEYPNGINDVSFDDINQELNSQRANLEAEGEDLEIENTFAEREIKRSENGYTSYKFRGIGKDNREKEVNSKDHAIKNKTKIVDEENKDEIINKFLDLLSQN